VCARTEALVNVTCVPQQQEETVIRLMSHFGEEAFLNAYWRVLAADRVAWYEVGAFFELMGLLHKRGLASLDLLDDLLSHALLQYWNATAVVTTGYRAKFHVPQVNEWVEYLARDGQTVDRTGREPSSLQGGRRAADRATNVGFGIHRPPLGAMASAACLGAVPLSAVTASGSKRWLGQSCRGPRHGPAVDPERKPTTIPRSCGCPRGPHDPMHVLVPGAC